MNKKEFVTELGKLLTMAKPHLVKCEYMNGQDLLHKWANEGRTDKFYFNKDEYVVITCENGYIYEINVTANSLNAIAEAVFHAMACK